MPEAAADQADFESQLAVPRRTWRENLALGVRAGWRPFFGWSAGVGFVTEAVVVPAVTLLRGQPVSVEWVHMAVYVGAVSLLFLPRSAEKITGAAQ